MAKRGFLDYGKEEEKSEEDDSSKEKDDDGPKDVGAMNEENLLERTLKGGASGVKAFKALLKACYPKD